MKPVSQALIDDGIGDCLSACVASILELPLEGVPQFVRLEVEAEKRGEQTYGIRHRLIEWLEGRGLGLVYVEFVKDSALNRAYVGHGTHLILCGTSPRRRADGGTKEHAVVGVTKGWGFKVAHDPHPDGTGLEGVPTSAWWIVGRVPASPEPESSTNASAQPIAAH